MSDRIDSSSGIKSAFVDTSPDTAGPAPVGVWHGEEVRVEPPDLASLLDDAKEELTFSHSERMEAKEVKEREIQEPDPVKVEHAEAIQAYLDQLPDFDPGEFERMLQDMRGDASPDPGSVLERAQGHFPDPSHADAALDLAEQTLRQEGRTVQADAAAAARAMHRDALAPAIRAGLNVGVAAFEAAKGDRAAAQALRDGYRSTVFTANGAQAVYRGILNRLNVPGAEPSDLRGQLRFLTRALGDDLASAGPSAPRALLEQLITDLSALRVLDTVHDRCGVMAGRVRRQSGVELQVPKVMEKLLPLTEEPVNGPGRIVSIPRDLGIPARRLDTQVLFLQEARDVLAMMPPAVFRDADARFAALRGMQEAIDATIEREEAE